MKKDIHPQYFREAKVSCACGNKFTTGSTVKELHVEICSACHPFYTGKSKIVDAARRIDRFQQRAAKQKTVAKTRAQSQTSKLKAKAARKKPKAPLIENNLKNLKVKTKKKA